MDRTWPPLDGVRKIAVLRPNAVGDFVFALPALHALKHTYPDAELVFIGKAWHRVFLAGRPGPVDRVVEMPAVPGVGVSPAGMATRIAAGAAAGVAAGVAADIGAEVSAEVPAGVRTEVATGVAIEVATEAAVAATVAAAEAPATALFIERMRGERFDLALQMFGGGLYSNPFLMQWGARLTVGMRAPDAPAPDRWLPYREPVNRRLALLELAGLAGAWPGPMPMPELAVTAIDRARAAQVLPPRAGERLVILQPGATDPRRRWPPERFAALGDMLAAQGAQVVINGAPAEAALVEAVAGGMRHRAVLPSGPPGSGGLDLGGLCGLLERAALVVSNDTGPLHLALALGVPSVGIFWLTNLLEGMPLRASGLWAALSVRTRCPVCGQDNLRRRCAHDVSFVDEVSVDEVAGLARAALAASAAWTAP